MVQYLAAESRQLFSQLILLRCLFNKKKIEEFLLGRERHDHVCSRLSLSILYLVQFYACVRTFQRFNKENDNFTPRSQSETISRCYKLRIKQVENVIMISRL